MGLFRKLKDKRAEKRQQRGASVARVAPRTIQAKQVTPSAPRTLPGRPAAPVAAPKAEAESDEQVTRTPLTDSKVSVQRGERGNPITDKINDILDGVKLPPINLQTENQVAVDNKSIFMIAGAALLLLFFLKK